jgi:hypothetical protein
LAVLGSFTINKRRVPSISRLSSPLRGGLKSFPPYPLNKPPLSLSSLPFPISRLLSIPLVPFFYSFFSFYFPFPLPVFTFLSVFLSHFFFGICSRFSNDSSFLFVYLLILRLRLPAVRRNGVLNVGSFFLDSQFALAALFPGFPHFAPFQFLSFHCFRQISGPSA